MVMRQAGSRHEAARARWFSAAQAPQRILCGSKSESCGFHGVL